MEKTEVQPAEAPASTQVENTKKETYTPKATDCELLYELGSSEYALCEYTRTQNAQNNTNMAIMFLLTFAVAIGIVSLIVHSVERSVERDYSRHK